MSTLITPKGYHPLLSVKETEQAIVAIKNFFQLNLSTELNLTRVTAPLFVAAGTGLNDDLNGTEKAVSFTVQDLGNRQLDIVHSLAKWKRVKIGEMKLACGFGIYSDMNAIRKDETLDNIHSLYVDQWDWELAITEEQRTLDELKSVVKKIFYCLKRLEFFIYDSHPAIKPILPEKITFLHAEDLYVRYPHLSAKEREHAVAEEFGAVFIIGIGRPLADGKPHDGRACDYDDWITKTEGEHYGLNGDLLVWNPVLEQALELSSMGIRVSPATLQDQLEMRGEMHKKDLFFHSQLIKGLLPQTIGGGIGQSRLCMYMLRKAHIGEVQVSVWPETMKNACREANIILL